MMDGMFYALGLISVVFLIDLYLLKCLLKKIDKETSE